MDPSPPLVRPQCRQPLAVRWARGWAVACSGLALLVLVAVMVPQQNGRRGGVMLLSSGLKEEASSRTSLSDSERSSIKERVKKLEKKVKHEQDEAAKLDSKVEKREMTLRKKLLSAKDMRAKGDKLEHKAEKEVHQVDKLRARAERLRKESEEAKQRFLRAEKPVELATKLADHDHKKYREEELEVARDVTELSEHPNDPKVRKSVNKMVAESKAAKKKMAEDMSMLNKLQSQAGNSDFGGEKSYHRLKERSVEVAKDAERIAVGADKLAEEGHADRSKAARIVKSVKGEMDEPAELHKKAEALRKKYKVSESELKELRHKLDGSGGSNGKEETESKYSRDREELRKVLATEGDKDSGDAQAHHGEGDSVEGRAQSQYAQLEASALRKEKEVAKRARDNSWDGESQSLASDTKAQFDSTQDSAQGASGHGKELSLKQSTFLSGLFSSKAPWDTDNERNSQM